MLGNIISRLLGLVRDQVIGAVFGAKIATDVFIAASTVPTMVYDLLVSGAISAALIPVFADYADSHDREEFSRIISAVLTLATAALAVVVAFLVVLAPLLVDVIGGGFSQEAKAVTTYLVRLMLPSVLFMGTSGILTASLYARQRFTLPAFSVAVYNVGIILGALLLADRIQVSSLVIGVLVGAVLQVAVQLPGMRGIRLRPRLDLSHPGVRAILKLYTPVALGLLISNSGIIVDRYLASSTGEGSMAAMRFATTLVQFPLGLVATATSFAVLPTLSRQAGVGGRGEGRAEASTHHSSLITHYSAPDPSAYAATLRMGMKMILVLIVPAAVGLAVLREPIVQLLFERGAFDHTATARTALAFLGYSPGIAFAAVDQLLIFSFYARKDTRTPVLVGVMAIFAYLAVALSLIQPLGMLGLVLANAVQNTSHALVLLWLLNRRVAGVVDRDLASFLGRIVAAAAVMGLACQLALAVAHPLAATGPGVALLVAASAALGAAVYVAAVVALRVREANQVWELVVGRLRHGTP
jgi:putative peptidoglycan lipid II flippase